jgi:ATP-dependent DNA helicase PIF1
MDWDPWDTWDGPSNISHDPKFCLQPDDPAFDDAHCLPPSSQAPQGSAPWPSSPPPPISPLGKRSSNSLEAKARRSHHSKRRKRASADVIVISDSDDDEDNEDSEDNNPSETTPDALDHEPDEPEEAHDGNDEAQGEDTQIQDSSIDNSPATVLPAPAPLTALPTLPSPPMAPPVDHLGRPLSEPALAAARDYWACQRKLDFCPFDEGAAQGSTLPVDVLFQAVWHRRSYTRLLFGVEKLEPGTRTYEPPFVEPLPALPLLPLVPAPYGLSGPPNANPSIAPPPAPPAPAAPQEKPRTEPALCPEQQEVVDLAARGRNIFYTGSAGCGKSTVLHAIRKRLRDQGKIVRVMAPTGKVALAINGTTTWTFAGMTPDHHKRALKQLEKAALGKTPRQRFCQTDTIIIDEISMVENLHFERLNAILKSGRSNSDPFGGVQVIVTGDFCQLPPVKPFQHCITCGSDLVSSDEPEDTIHTCRRCNKIYYESDKWAFRSKAWKESNFIHIHLKSIHRQSDGQFIGMLQKCRLGVPFNSEELNILMNHKSATANAVKLYSTREEVRRTNEEAFARLKTPPHPYSCFDKFIWDEDKHPNLAFKAQRNPDNSLRALDDHRFDRRMELKIGMLVVLLVNLDLPSGLCNGSQGIVAGFEAFDPAKLPRKIDPREGGGGPGALLGQYATVREEHIKQFSEQQLRDPQRKQLCWPIVRFLNGTVRTIMPECQVHELGDREPYSLLCRTQIPLAAAWALSIHKSQGMTLDRVVVDLSRAFEDGQVYVALSRATSLQGLKIEGDVDGLAVGKGGNAQVRAFLKERFGM